jgi:hypothetical protein
VKVIKALGCLIIFALGLLGGGFLGVSGTTGPDADRQLHLFIDQYGQVQPDVTPHTEIFWTKLGGKDGNTIVPVQDIKFKGNDRSPCKEGDPTQGRCTIDVKDGWHPYDCPQSCVDPTMPVGSRTRGGGGGGSGSNFITTSTVYAQARDSSSTAAEPAPQSNSVGVYFKKQYFALAGDFDNFLHSLWSGDDKPVEPIYPPEPPPMVAPNFPNGPLARESVICGSDGVIAVPADQTLYTQGITSPMPGTTITWDSAGGMGSEWSIQDTSGPGPHLSDICDKGPPYIASSETAGACHLKTATTGAALPDSIRYEVVAKTGACVAKSPQTVTLALSPGPSSPLR